MNITLGRVAAAAAVLIALPLAGAAQAAAPYEPNDSPESAFGPIGTVGGLHVIEAAGETALDEDWFSFFVPDGSHDVAIGLAQLTPDAALCMRVQVEDDEGVSELASIETDGAEPAGQLEDTISGPARAFVSVDGCTGFAALPARYRLTLQGDWPSVDPRPADEPAGLDGPVEKSAGSGVRARCHVAAVKLRTARARLASARRADRKQHSRVSKRRLATARKARTRAIAKVVRLC